MSPLTVHVLLLAGGVAVLFFGADWLVRGAARLAASLGVTPIVVGLTVVSLGTSAPELMTCLVAALRDNSDLAMGNVMGSNLANIGLILGLTAVIRPLDVASRVTKREVPLMLLVTGLLYPMVMDGDVSRLDGLALLAFLGGYLAFVFRTAEDESPEVLGEFEQFARETRDTQDSRPLLDLGLVAVGSVGLVLGGYAIVEGAVFVADAYGMPEVVIGLTLVAVGTSLPELATSLVAALRKEADIAVGNIIGSNIFNISAILGTVAVVKPLTVTPSILVKELPAVLIMSVLLVPIARSAFRIRRWEGALLLATYVGLGAWVLL